MCTLGFKIAKRKSKRCDFMEFSNLKFKQKPHVDKNK